MTVYALVPVAIASALTAGGVLALAASLGQPLGQRLNLSEPQSRGLAAALALVLVPLLPLSGILTDSFGIEQGLIAGAVLAALGLSVLALRESFATALTGLFLIAAATAMLLSATTALLPATFFPARPTAAICAGYAVIGMGAVLFPLVADLLLPSLRWRRGLLLLALVCLAPAIVAALTPASEFPQDRSPEGPRLMQSHLVWLGGLVCFLYLPIEIAVVNFTTTQLGGIGYTNRQSTWLHIGFWTAFLAARLAAMMFVLWGTIRPGREGWVLFGLGLALAVSLGNLSGSGGKTSIGWGTLLAGFFCGPVYPLLLGVVVYRFHDEPGTAFGMVAGLGWLGALLATPLLHAAARHATPQRALRLPLVLSLLLAAAALVLELTA